MQRFRRAKGEGVGGDDNAFSGGTVEGGEGNDALVWCLDPAPGPFGMGKEPGGSKGAEVRKVRIIWDRARGKASATFRWTAITLGKLRNNLSCQ